MRRVKQIVKQNKWARQGSNLRPPGYEPDALPLSYEPKNLQVNNIMSNSPLFQSSASQPQVNECAHNQSVMSRSLCH